jgi:hypothetical protein
VTYAYQWYRCDATGAHCSSIHGATRSSYTEVAKDVGKKPSVKTGTWSGKPRALTYAWLRCNSNGRACSGVQGAAGSRYVLTADDRGHEIVAAVHAAAGAAALATASLPVS